MPLTNVGSNGSTVNVRPPAPRRAAPPPPRVVANPDQQQAPPPRVVANPDNQVQTPRPQGAPPSHTDITSSGPGYGSARANSYKQTPAYRQTVAHVFKIQPAAQQAAIISGLVRQNLFNTPEFAAVSSTFRNLIRSNSADAWKVVDLIPRELHAAGLLPQKLASNAFAAGGPLEKGIYGAVSHATSGAVAGFQGAANKALFPDTLRNAKTGAAVEGLGGSIPRVLFNAPLDVGRAAVEDPLGVLPKTAKGLADATVGMVAAGAQIPYNIITQGPGPALSNLAKSAAADYSRRYGPIASGNDQAFINRIKKEGAGPEVFDALAVAGGLDATAGRAAADLGRVSEKLTGRANVFTRDRPALRLSGNKTRPQAIAPTAGRALAQRAEDRLRIALTKRNVGELRPHEREVAPIFRSHAIRLTHSGISQKWRRAQQEVLRREVRGNHSSAQHAIGELNSAQRQAIFHAIHGVRVDTPAHFTADLLERAKAITEERVRNPQSLGNRIPAQYANKVDELKLIERLLPQAAKIAGPKMVAFQKGEAARAARIEGLTDLNAGTSEARRLRPLGDRLGVEHPDVASARELAHLRQREATVAALVRRPGTVGELHAARAALKRTHDQIVNLTEGTDRPLRLAAYAKQVRAKGKGLPEPGYFRHQPRPETKFGDFTSGSGARAMPADKQSKWELYRAGAADTSHDAYIQGLARSVKRPLQWRMTDEQFRAAALPTPTRAEIRAALGRNKAVHLLTGHELRQVLAHRGEDLNHVAFYNPGRLSRQTLEDHGLAKGKAVSEPHEEQINQELHDALNQHDVVQHPGKPLDQRFLATQGWKAVPKTALDEIQGGLKGSSLGGRVVGKVQGTTAGLILAQNPHFLIMNTLAHAIPAIMGTKGAILPDLLKTPFWWHGLTDAEKDAWRMHEAGRAGHYNTTARLGSQAPNKIAEMGRNLAARGLVQRANALNPLHAILRAEDTQSNFFRHAVMYHEAKKMAYQSMAHEYSRSVAAWEQVKHIFTLGPKERLAAIAQNMPKLEELGRTEVNLLGDYGRFTARERAFFNNRGVLFYSFLRHVTRTLLYVLPMRHPLALGLMGELGNLHAQEVKKLLGGQDLPWAYGRMFFDKNGKLSSIDTTSTSPISSPLVDLLSGGPKELPRLVSPALGPLFDIAYGQTPTGQPVPRNLATYANDMFSLSYPYRQLSAIHFGLKAQQPDSIPFVHERPTAHKTRAAQEYQAAKERARGPLSKYLLGSALGVFPKPDDSRVIAQNRAAKAAAKGRGRGGGGGGAGGWWSNSTSSPSSGSGSGSVSGWWSK